MSEKKSSGGVAKALMPYVTAGTSAMLASACVSPMDVTKTRLQVMAAAGGPRPSLVTVMSSIIKNDGITGLYAGLSASLMRQAVYGTARIGLHTEFTDKMKAAQGGGELATYKTIGSSMLSGTIASIIGNPFDISMVRMQADSLKPVAERRNYKNVFDAIATIARTEGVANLWRGFEPTVFRAVAMNVGMLAVNDIAKAEIRKINGDGRLTNLSAAAVSGLACVCTSLPFDMIKTRLQNMKPNAEGVMPYAGVVDCATKIARVEGPLAFYTGFSAYYGRTAPHAMIILIVLDELKKAYSSAFNL